MPRRKREGEYVCTCGAYRFPHRFGGGRCWGVWMAEDSWERTYGISGPCSGCNHVNTDESVPECEVLSGREKLKHCEAWTEFVAFHGIHVTKKGLL